MLNWHGMTLFPCILILLFSNLDCLGMGSCHAGWFSMLPLPRLHHHDIMTIVGLFVLFVTMRRVPYGKKANEDTFSVNCSRG